MPTCGRWNWRRKRSRSVLHPSARNRLMSLWPSSKTTQQLTARTLDQQLMKGLPVSLTPPDSDTTNVSVAE